jgi:hypothetical protein
MGRAGHNRSTGKCAVPYRHIFPRAGIQDNTVNRLLLMSSSEKHLPNVPMAFYINANSSPRNVADRMTISFRLPFGQLRAVLEMPNLLRRTNPLNK